MEKANNESINQQKIDKDKALEIFETLNQMFPNACCELNYRNLYELCIAVILSAQTTDAQVNIVSKDLFEKYPSVEDLSKATEEEVIPYIARLGLFRNKAKNIINFAKMVVTKYGTIPGTFDELVLLPGVGRKTANVILSEYFNVPRIAVDTHVLRVANKLRLSNSDNTLIVEKDLMNLYPEKIWSRVHLVLLFFGRYFCTAKKPNCAKCFNRNECISYISNNKK